VVEDEEFVRNFLHLGLTRLGYQARVAASVREGQAALAEEAFDVILTDLGLPDGSGEEVIRSAAQHAPTTPVVLLTGWAEQMRASAPAGVTALLGKPISLDDLAQTLARLKR
jgi:CheY-like chemotaxis protein